METIQNLNDNTVDLLQKIVQANIDSCKGYQESAEDIKNNTIASSFRSIASQRSGFAKELQTYVQWNGEDAKNDSSLKADLHRAWLKMRAKITDGDEHAVLSEAERGEDYIKDLYEKVLKENPGTAVNNVLLTQYEQIKSDHDAVRDLRDALQ